MPFILEQIFSTTISSSPRIAAIVEGVSSQAFCIANARLCTNSKPSSNFRHLLETRADISPRECPATKSGLNFSPNASASITECKKIAGCVTLVCFKSSVVPLNIISEILNPRISLDFSNNSFETFLDSYRSLPIPGNWAPCPGNTYAFILFNFYCQIVLASLGIS